MDERIAKVVCTEKAPTPIGQYSQAIKAGRFVFLAGQVGQDPKTGEVIKEDIDKEIEQLFENMKAILEEAGASLDNVVKTTTFVKDLKIYDAFKRVRARYISKEKPPANTMVQVADLLLGASIEIEAIAIVP